MIKTNLAVLMAERGLKIADVFEDTGISKTTLMALTENTGKGVQFDTVDKLCNYLGVEIKDFFVYVPYIWEMYLKPTDEAYISNIVVKLKHKNTEQDYFIDVINRNPQNYDFPLDNNDKFKVWVVAGLENSDAYDINHFFDFLNSLPVSMKTIFVSQLIDIIKSSFKINSRVIIRDDHLTQINDDFYHEITLNKGDKIFISLFNQYFYPYFKELENTKTITI